MEDAFAQFALMIALAVEAVMVAVIVIGTAEAFYRTVELAVTRNWHRSELRETWLRYAAWIVLGLEFALAADLIRTVVTPSWDEIGKLATIGAIRTALSWFLGRDIAEFNTTDEKT